VDVGSPRINILGLNPSILINKNQFLTISLAMVDKVSPNDSRIQYKTASLNGVTYSYILAEPSGQPKSTVVLIHGWPDLSLGWRYQIPLLTSMGFRVLAPDMMGYGGTDAPGPLNFYTYKRAADDIAELARQIGAPSIILGGHDWGGAIVYRIALWYPKLVSAVFSVCTPYHPPRPQFVDATKAPNFKYQLQLRGPDVEANIVGEEKLRQFLNALYGGRTPNGETGFSTSQGCDFEVLPRIGPTKLLSEEEVDFYVKRYAIHGMRGPLNWYRTQELNFEDEKEMAKNVEGFKFMIPFLFIAGTRDAALPPAISQGMDKWFDSLTRREVNTSHWALWEKPEEVNEHIREFLSDKIETLRSSL
jgi:soluble epoxide hydrolase/lipid-phosphate phosphatase